MRVAKLLVVLAIVALATSGTAVAGPGDSCNEAIDVSPGTYSGSILGGSRWYTFTASEDKIVPINTSLPGTNFDTHLAVFGACGAAPIVENSGIGERKAHASVQTFPGQVLFIEVSRIDGAGTSFEVSIDNAQLGPCPGAGDCFSANGTIACDDTCGGPGCPGCCASICAADSFCCATEWDQICADAAISTCVVVPVDLQTFEIDG